MKKSESEAAIRQLCHVWAKERGIQEPPKEQPSFSDFTSWLSEKGYSHYLNFRTTGGPHDRAEFWFDQEFKQTWRY